MKNETVVVVINKGMVQDVYSDNTNLVAKIIDLDLKKNGEDYQSEFAWPDTQFDEEKIKELTK